MTAHRRRLAAAALVWALLPLPFVGLVLPPFWLTAAAAAVLAWSRAGRGVRRLGPGVQNVLAVAMVLAVLAAGGLRVGPLRPLGHLLVLLAALKTTQVADRRSFHGALALAGAVWVSAVASSHHVALLPYLLGSAGVLWWGGMRVLLMDRAEEAGVPAPRVAGLPPVRPPALAALLSVALMVPVFVLVPRLRSPVVSGGGFAGRVTGFTSAVELGGVGRIKSSSRVALVVSPEDPLPARGLALRLRGAAFDLIRTGMWRARRGRIRPLPLRDGVQWLGTRPGSLEGTLRVSVEVLRPRRYLFVPEGAVAVRCSRPLGRNPAGSIVLPRGIRGPVTAEFFIRPGASRELEPPASRDLMVQVRDPRLEPLARRLVAGAASPEEKALAITRYIRSTCSYSLDVEVPLRADPVAWFLFDARRGHCELFAGSLAVLLRMAGVPARMVGGYLPGRLRPGDRRLMVRESQAHTWVEVWLGPRRGWVIFDPTPAEGVPGGERSVASWWRRARDEVELFWDRWILTFGLGEQLELLESAAAWVARGARRGVPVLAAVVLLAVLLRLGLRRLYGVRRGLGGGPASRRLRQVERRLRAAGLPPGPAATPREVARAAAARWPAEARELLDLARAAEWELYGPGGSSRSRAAAQGPRGASAAPASTSIT